MSRFNIVLVVLAAVQLAILVYVKDAGTVEKPERDPMEGTKPFEQLALKSLQTLQITDDDGRTVVIERAPEPANQTAEEKERAEKGPGEWILASKDGYPVRAEEVKTAVESLQKIKLGRVITRRPNRHVSLLVADSSFSRRLVAKDRSGKTVADFYIGDSRGGGSGTLFRNANDDAVFQSGTLKSWHYNADDTSWADSSWLEEKKDEVARLKLERGEHSFEILREERPLAIPTPKKDEEKKDGEKKEMAETETVWVVRSPEARKGEVLDKTKVESAIGSMTRLNLTRVIGKKDAAKDAERGFDQPSTKATFTFADGRVLILTIGQKTPDQDSESFARSSESEFDVTLGRWKISSAFEKTLDDLAVEKKDPTESGANKD